MGKCFSCCDRGQRKKSDFYQTSLSLVWQLLEVENFKGRILEPASGNNVIVNVLKKKLFNKIDYSDIKQGYDFLKENKEYNNIITNPPFSLAFEFIIKAKELFKNKIAFLLPLSYLHGQKRYENKVFNELKTIYVFTRYPLLTDKIRSDGKYNTGFIVYAWYIWEKDNKKEPVIRWLNNQQYILKRNEK